MTRRWPAGRFWRAKGDCVRLADLSRARLAPPQQLSPAERRQYKRSYFALISSSFVSNTGNAFSNLAIPLFVLATTGSATRTGIVAFVNYAPPVIAAIFGGALVDRIGRRKTPATR